MSKNRNNNERASIFGDKKIKIVSAHAITLIVITIIILIALVGIIISLNLEDNSLFNISKIMEKNKLAETEEKEEPILSYKLYDNTGEKLQVLAIIKKEEGIQSIEYTDENGKDILLHCNNKQKVGIDIQAETNKDYTFKIVSNDVEYIETFNIPEDYIENYISVSKLDDESTETVYKYNIEYNTDLDESEGVTYYYKIGKDSTNWTKYKGNISASINNSDNIGNTTTTLLTKQVDSLGATILREDIIDVPTSDVDVFAAIISSVGTLDRGISVSYYSAESSRFEAYHLGVGHSKDRSSFSATYKILASTFSDYLIAEQLYVDYNLYANTYQNSWPSTIGASATIYYTDGTTTSQSVSNKTYDSYTSVPITLDIKQGKTINYILLQISGFDNNYTGAYGYISNITLKNASLISTEEE